LSNNNKIKKIRRSSIREHDLVRRTDQELCAYIPSRSIEKSGGYVENIEGKRKIEIGEEKVQ